MESDLSVHMDQAAARGIATMLHNALDGHHDELRPYIRRAVLDFARAQQHDPATGHIHPRQVEIVHSFARGLARGMTDPVSYQRDLRHMGAGDELPTYDYAAAR
jgi:hypothetical protein